MRVTLVVERSDGGVVDIELRRPAEWVESLRLEPVS